MNLQDTVAFWGNVANILTPVGGLLFMTGGRARRRQARADTLPEPVNVELAAQDAVMQLRQSAYAVRRAMIAAACEALKEQAELESP